ncbi:MAG: hypothetical protein IJH34_14595 [Romboutsia sp.]|nr:hypothetical protein [Romboutsia sp.]
MNQILFKKALEHYRNQEDLEEIEEIKNKKYLFVDTLDGYTFPLNNIDEISIVDFFVDSNNSDCKITNINQFVNLKELTNILKMIEPKFFFFLNEILVLLNEDDIYVVENYLSRELLDETVGQTTHDTNSIVINMIEIFKGVKKMDLSKDKFFHTCVYQFYITLLHELGHISLRDNLLNSEYYPLKNTSSSEEDEVEMFAEYVFSHLDSYFNDFKPFNREFIESKF